MKRKWLYFIPLLGWIFLFKDKYETEDAGLALAFIFWQLLWSPIPLFLCIYFKLI